MKGIRTRYVALFLWLIILTVFVQACGGAPEQTADAPTPAVISATVAPPSATHTETPTATATPAPTATLTPSPTDTPTETDIPESVLLQAELQESIADPAWQELDFSEARAGKWRAFAGGQTELSEDEMARVKGFLAQWRQYRPLLDIKPVPNKVRPALRLRRFLDEQGEEGLALFAIDERSLKENGPTDLLLLAKDQNGKPVSLILAPQIEGLEQRISQDGAYVEYIDPDGRWLLRADGRKINENSDRQQEFKDMIDESGIALDYVVTSTYPRYYLNLPTVDAAFYAIGNLTYSQLLLLNSMLELYYQDDLVELMPYIFASGEDVEYIVSRFPHPFAAALARPLGGSPQQGIIVLYTKNLFDNRYDTASSLAHEAAHIWQGKITPCLTQADEDRRLVREVGKGVVPDDFYNWTADDLVKAVRRGEIGAYHMSLWVLTKFHQTDHAAWVRQVIQSGRANGYPLIDCYP